MPNELDLHRLPIVIGVTGHRALRAADEPALARALESIFRELQVKYPSTPLLLLTPLAEGADQLAAEVARRRSIPYRVPIPMPLANYREDFTEPGRLEKFEELLRDANGPPYAMPFFESNDAGNISDAGRRSHQYALLAAHLSQAAHVFVAFWDGVASDTVGGTAQAVRFRVLGVPERYGRSSVIDAPETGPVYHIYTPRLEAPLQAPGKRTLRIRRPADGARPLIVGSVEERFAQIVELPAESPDPCEPLLRQIQSFNDDCARLPSRATSSDECATRALMHSAERVATYYQRRFVTALQIIFLSAAAAVLTFGLYADILQHVPLVVILYLAVSSAAVFTYLSARRGRWQDRAQDYRALEIGLHVQQAWDAAGVAESVADSYLRRQRGELDWIRDAIRTAHLLDLQRPFSESRAIESVREFVEREYAYFAGTLADGRAGEGHGMTHPGAALRERRKARLHHRCNVIALRTSALLSICLIAYGLVAWLAPDRLAGLADEEVWHGYLMFSIGFTAASAALFHDYSSRRGHGQQARRYDLMAAMYQRALNALDAADAGGPPRAADDGPPPSRLRTAQACIRELGHEALSENGDWLLMHREFPLELIAMH